MVAGRRSAPLDAVCAEGGEALAAQVCDVTDEASVQALFEAAAERFGRIDLLFNNAGIAAQPAPVAEVTLDDWQKVLTGNVTGAFLCAREAFRHMARQSPEGRPDHQQRLALGADAAALVDRLHRLQARDHRPHPHALARRPRRTTSPAARSTSAMPRPR